jgi:tRNA (guanosine-2'-O-)-methyltransferase
MLEGQRFTAQQIRLHLAELITPERRERIRQTVSGRTYGAVAVLEDIYDRGNISAVMRSSEAMGFQNVHVIEKSERYKSANRVSLGAEKWLDVQKWKNTTACLTHLRQAGYQILATHLEASRPIDEVDFARPTAFILGNEKEGVSAEALAMADERVRIPMAGFVQSFNISVAGALMFYHIQQWRQRHLGAHGDLSREQQEILEAEFYLRSVAESVAILKLKAI